MWDKAVLDKLVHPSRGKVTKFALTAMNKVAMPSIVKCFMTHYGAHIAVIREDDDVPLMLRWMQNPDAKNWGRVSLPVVEVVPMAGAAQSAAVAAKLAQNGNAHNDEDNAEEEEEDEEEAEELPESAAESEEESPPPPPPPPPPTRAKLVKLALPAGPQQLWVCAGCTFQNDVNVKKCIMCSVYKAVVLDAYVEE